MNRDIREVVYSKTRNYSIDSKQKDRGLRINLNPKLHLNPQLPAWIVRADKGIFETVKFTESKVTFERHGKDKPVDHVYGVTEGDFWELLDSDRWRQCSSLRVSEGVLLDRLKEALFSLKNQNILSTHQCSKFDKLKNFKSLVCRKHIAKTFKTVEENIKVTFTYFSIRTQPKTDRKPPSILYTKLPPIKRADKISSPQIQVSTTKGATARAQSGSGATARAQSGYGDTSTIDKPTVGSSSLTSFLSTKVHAPSTKSEVDLDQLGATVGGTRSSGSSSNEILPDNRLDTIVVHSPLSVSTRVLDWCAQNPKYEDELPDDTSTAELLGDKPTTNMLLGDKEKPGVLPGYKPSTEFVSDTVLQSEKSSHDTLSKPSTIINSSRNALLRRSIFDTELKRDEKGNIIFKKSVETLYNEEVVFETDSIKGSYKMLDDDMDRHTMSESTSIDHRIETIFNTDDGIDRSKVNKSLDLLRMKQMIKRTESQLRNVKPPTLSQSSYHKSATNTESTINTKSTIKDQQTDTIKESSSQVEEPSQVTTQSSENLEVFDTSVLNTTYSFDNLKNQKSEKKHSLYYWTRIRNLYTVQSKQRAFSSLSSKDQTRMIKSHPAKPNELHVTPFHELFPVRLPADFMEKLLQAMDKYVVRLEQVTTDQGFVTASTVTFNRFLPCSYGKV